MRLFVGCFVRIEGYERIKKVFEPDVAGRWVLESNLHLTFRFLGEVTDENEVIRTLEPLVYRRGEAIAFERFGIFGRKILYAGTDHPVLYETALAIDALLGERETRAKSFVPHVTLMKISRLATPDIKMYLPPFPPGCRIDATLRVALICSELTREGPRYIVLKEF